MSSTDENDASEQSSSQPENYSAQPFDRHAIYGRLEETALAILLMAIVIVSVFAVVMRYVADSSFTWTEPLDRYLLIWLTFIGAAVAVKHDVHMAVGVSGKGYPKALKVAIVVANRGLQTVLFGYFAIYGYELAMANTSATTVPGVSRTLVLFAVPVAGALMVLHSVRHLVHDLRIEV